ncbi:hypothetical protein LINPERPRIM_LOCUS26676, partial [Linum perenne]
VLSLSSNQKPIPFSQTFTAGEKQQHIHFHRWRPHLTFFPFGVLVTAADDRRSIRSGFGLQWLIELLMAAQLGGGWQ